MPGLASDDATFENNIDNGNISMERNGGKFVAGFSGS